MNALRKSTMRHYSMNHCIQMFTCWLGGFATSVIFFKHFEQNCNVRPVPQPVQPTYKNCTCTLTPNKAPQPEKPILLVWDWPETNDFRFDPVECKKRFNIDSCHLTDDRNLYKRSDAVLFYHKAIKDDLSNLPKDPRPHFQKWIWFNLESPTNTRQKAGLENIFNLTLTYRRDSDISVRYDVDVSKTPLDFKIPKKDKLVCWFVSNMNPYTGTGKRTKYYEELSKYIKVNVYGKMAGSHFEDKDYYPIMESCKFYLSFENSIHKDYMTEKLNGPFAVGTVPIVLGPPRENYEQFAPRDAFIHVDDFPNATVMADYILKLDKDDEAYKRYFDWRKYMSVIPHYKVWNDEFILPICRACDYIARHKEYKETHELFKWYFS
ncbi:4-galactosyl-N-acetylglucosaminide 3-alpha-L-fucosyltransferase 9-like [Colossoma macropomum]|uniref:4-galactosyl-N-acetylglucosaminide 3-alpha-L-fucosyltransferase 9-like n=1 Tax=Colossoma macropomum TaxID=42526 RepID=UPI0018642193|nr:4-galactosyl-N-acetylglucosaminide 3-alpha-L-fucosyltransferase 9-like [Colossoma macropomum]XP_036419575.1 4-galactosyl-N-acetylglucosaminide 3-alpha-L-fucosyltransferase 9-like [Colossoma macropomum]